MLNTFSLNPSFAVDNNTQNKSSLDIQQIQTRTYSATYDQVYRYMVSVLKDNRFKITHKDKDSGIVSADGNTEASENMSDAVATLGGFVLPFFDLFPKKQVKNGLFHLAKQKYI